MCSYMRVFTVLHNEQFFIYSTFNKITSFPWKLNRYSYGVQFGINCTALDQSKLSNFVERTIISLSFMYGLTPLSRTVKGNESNPRDDVVDWREPIGSDS